METSTYAARMRYLDARDISDASVKYESLTVVDPNGAELGSVDGFIIDGQARRAAYVVIDSGGWFSSRRFLLPIGHAALAPDRRALQVDVSRDALSRLPEYDAERFRDFTDEELRAFQRNTVLACCPDEPLEDVSATTWAYDSQRHYQQPDWWRTVQYVPERLRPMTRVRAVDPAAPVTRPVTDGSRPAAAGTYAGELVTAREGRGDVSPHVDGRAQPGDVLGIETGGERTEIGDTAEDEDRRRRRAGRTNDER